MRHPERRNAKRIFAGIMGLMMLLIVLFSAFYIAAETDHDCEGEDCPVCVCLRQCENTLRRIGDGAAAPAAAILPVFFILLAAALFTAAVQQETPVSRKVRMND